MDKDLMDQYDVQSALQRENIEGQMSLNSPYMREQVAMAQAAVIEQLNPSHMLNEMEMILRGEFKDEKTGKLIKKVRPLMNDKGIQKMITYCRGIINTNTVISFLDNNEIRKIMNELSDDLVDDLSLNWKEYGITSKPDLDYINNIVLVMMFLSLKRCLQGGERNFLGKTTSEILNSKSGFGSQKNEGILSKFKL